LEKRFANCLYFVYVKNRTKITLVCKFFEKAGGECFSGRQDARQKVELLQKKLPF
jgi:hypothetical protein